MAGQRSKNPKMAKMKTVTFQLHVSKISGDYRECVEKYLASFPGCYFVMGKLNEDHYTAYFSRGTNNVSAANIEMLALLPYTPFTHVTHVQDKNVGFSHSDILSAILDVGIFFEVGKHNHQMKRVLWKRHNDPKPDDELGELKKKVRRLTNDAHVKRRGTSSCSYNDKIHDLEQRIVTLREVDHSNFIEYYAEIARTRSDVTPWCTSGNLCLSVTVEEAKKAADHDAEVMSLLKRRKRVQDFVIARSDIASLLPSGVCLSVGAKRCFREMEGEQKVPSLFELCVNTVSRNQKMYTTKPRLICECRDVCECTCFPNHGYWCENKKKMT